MKNYKAEIEKIIDGVFTHGQLTPELSSNVPEGQYTVAEGINKVESLIREIVQEAVGEDRQVVYYGDFIGHAKEAMQSLVNKGYNERGSEILSNVEEALK